MAKTGRPSKYSEKVATAICEQISQGKSLRQICEADDMPHRSNVFKWLNNHEEFRDQYARAREAQAEHMAEELLEIADDGMNDFVERHGPDGETYKIFDSEHVQRSRLRVDTRKWIMSKLLPKKYGDKQQVEHSGSVSLQGILQEIDGTTRGLPRAKG